jgi:DNA (cytosine-5)-methyltransferase 1
MANTNNSIGGGGECRRFWGAQKRYQEWDLHTIFNQSEPVRMVDGVASRVDRLKAIGNGQVPQVAAIAWELLNERI